MAVTSSKMADPLRTEFPEVEEVVRIWRGSETMVSYEQTTFQEEAGALLMVDSTFFTLFDFKLLQGDGSSVLSSPENIVISASVAQKFFGTENPIGKGLRMNDQDKFRTVSGVFEDVPVNSHVHFSYLIPIYDLPYLKNDMWLSHNFYTYVLLKEGTDQEHFTESLGSLLEKYVGPLLMQILNISLEEFLNQGNAFKYVTTPLRDIHLASERQYEIEPTGNKSYVVVFIALAILILVVASINFINLATARSADRALEVGIRKLLGAHRRALILQFLTESTILSLVSLVIAVILTMLAMPAFNNLIQSALEFKPFSNPELLLVLLLFGLGVGIGAGLYPAFVLATTRPALVLKGRRNGTGGKGRLRKILVIMQFAVTLVIVSGTVTAYRQLNFMQHKELGFDKNNVLVVNGGRFLNDQYEAFRGELLSQSSITEVARSLHLPGMLFKNNAHWLEGHGVDEIYTIMETRVSHEWGEVMGLSMAEGRFFDRNYPTDSAGAIINESAVRALNLEHPLESRLWVPPGVDREQTFIPILGVVKDFHFESMKNPIGPAVLYLIGPGSYGYISMRTDGTDNALVMQKTREIWSKLVPEYPLDAFWLDQFFERTFQAEKQTSNILLIFSILSLIISSLGLLGMISFTTRTRRKEIAIRKTYGSTVPQVVFFLFKETWILLGIATLLAFPSFYVVAQWMNGFAYKIDFSVIIFLVTLAVVSVLILVLAALSVSQEAIKAARANPAEALSTS